MLPIPSINYIPKIYRDNVTVGVTALTDKIDDIIEYLRDDILALAQLKQVETCPEKFLLEMGYLLSANAKFDDSDRTKREKIFNAIRSHKLRGSWVDNVKLTIDAITGYTANIFRSTDSDDWILTGDGSLEVGSDWAILGGDGTAPYGMSLIGVGDEIEIAGNIYIDCHTTVHTSTLTATQIEKIVADIAMDVVPAYMRVYLGYVDTLGGFVVYSGGTIG